MAREILFDHRDKRWSWLSNFHAAPIELDGQRWATVEHFFQAAKFPDEGQRERIRAAPTPHVAKTMGQTRTHPIHPNWDELRIEVMRRAVGAKFAQHPDLADRLIATRKRMLRENNPRDNFWGIGKGTGQNRLGLVLMELRATLREDERGRAVVD